MVRPNHKIVSLAKTIMQLQGTVHNRRKPNQNQNQNNLYSTQDIDVGWQHQGMNREASHQDSENR